MAAANPNEIVAFATQAMVASLSSSTSSDQRHQSQNFLEQLLASQECSMVLQSILSSEVEDNIGLKILALSMLHEWIKRWWNNITPADHLSMRNFCASILRQPAVAHQPSNFRSKLAAILAEIGERQFPQEWTSMVQELTEVWVGGLGDAANHPFIQEIVIKTLTFIYTDCTDQDFSSQLPTVRRQEILSGLKAHDAHLLMLLHSFLCSHLQILLQGGEQPAATSERSVVLGLQLLRSMTGLETPEKFAEPQHNFLVVLNASLQLPNLLSEAAHCLHALFARKMQNPTAGIYLAHLAELPILLPTDLEDRLSTQRVLLTSIAGFLSSNIAKLMEETPCPSALLDAVFQRAIKLLQGEGRRALGETLLDWAKVFREEGLKKYPHSPMVAQALLEVYYHKSVRPSFLLPTGTDSASPSPIPIPLGDVEEWFEIEFDDREDWQDFFGTYSNQLSHLVHSVSLHYLEVVVALLLAGAQEILIRSQQVEWTLVLTQFQVFTKFLGGFLEAFASFLPKVHGSNDGGQSSLSATSASATSAPSPSTQATTVQILDLLLNQWNPPTEQRLLLEEKMRMLALYSHVLSILSADQVLAILARLFQYLQSPGLAEASQIEAGKCFSTFIDKAAQSLAVSPVFPDLLQQTSTALERIPSLDVQCSLQQSLLSLLPFLPNLSLQQSLCETALAGSLASLRNAMTRLCTSSLSAEGFLQILTTQPQEALAQISQVRHAIHRLTSIFAKTHPVEIDASVYALSSPSSSMPASSAAAAASGINLVFFQSKSPVYNHWIAYLQLCIASLRIFQHPMLSMQIACLHGVDFTDVKRATTTVTVTHPEAQLNFECKELVLQVYRSLALACRYKFGYYLSDMVQYLQADLPRWLPLLPNCHVLAVVKVLLPAYVVHVLPNQDKQVINTLAFLTTHLVDRLQVAWGIPSTTSPASGAPPASANALYALTGLDLQSWGLAADQSALVTEMVILDLTKAYVDVLCTIYATQGNLKMVHVSSTLRDDQKAEAERIERDKTLRRDFIRVKLLHTPMVLESILRSLVLLFALPHSAVLTGCLNLAMSLVDDVKKDERIAACLSGEVFRAALYAMLKQEKWLVGGQEWQLVELLLVIYCVIGLGFQKDTLTAEGGDHSHNGSAAGNAGADKNSKSKMTSWTTSISPSKPKPLPARITNLPRETLLKTQLVAAPELEAFERQIKANQGKKKQQRALIKDLLSSMVQRLHGSEQLAQLGSMLVSVQPKIMNLAQRLQPQKAESERQVARQDLGSVDLAGLFDDDPDL